MPWCNNISFIFRVAFDLCVCNQESIRQCWIFQLIDDRLCHSNMRFNDSMCWTWNSASFIYRNKVFSFSLLEFIVEMRDHNNIVFAQKHFNILTWCTLPDKETCFLFLIFFFVFHFQFECIKYEVEYGHRLYVIDLWFWCFTLISCTLSLLTNISIKLHTQLTYQWISVSVLIECFFFFSCCWNIHSNHVNENITVPIVIDDDHQR